MRWELFCRVIDNHGDLGVCWRLARQLGARGDAVRLWVDDASALAWMAPQGAAGVSVHPFDEASGQDLGDVVVEAFGCDPPAAVRRAMAHRRPAPVWIDLEYLSAEPYVERSHGLPSPQADGLTRWFFFPGFTPRTGGLLRDDAAPGLHDARAWLQRQGLGPRPGERVASLFCYPHARLADWIAPLAAEPTLLLCAPGAATEQLRGLALPDTLRPIALPWLPQADYDRLLQACDLNMVRGEDSFAQAQHAGAPLLWHIYPQHDGAHAAKLDAWLDLLLADADPAMATDVRHCQRAWNGLAPPPQPSSTLPCLGAWRAAQQRLRTRLAAQPDLATALRRFALSRPEKP